MNLHTVSLASKFRYRAEKVMMRTLAVPVLFVCLSALSAVAQLPTSTPESTAPQAQAPALPMAQSPAMETFNGSGTVDKLVPGVIPLSLLDAMDRGLKHNLGLLLSQQQSEQARAQYRRQLSALLPNISGNGRETVNQI